MLRSLRGSRRWRRLAIIAGAVIVAAATGVTGAIAAQAAETTGRITGRITDNGAPVPSVYVSLMDTDYNYIDIVYTFDGNGFTFDNVPEGSYKLWFEGDGFQQWHSQKRSFAEADLVTVTAGETTVVDEELRAHGALAGRVQHADGTPVAHSLVTARPVSGEFGDMTTWTDQEGNYRFPYLDAGEYYIGFYIGYTGPVQWANNAASDSDATPIQAQLGEVTALDQTLPAMGTIAGVITSQSQPVPYAQVVAESDDHGWWFTGFTDWYGRYSLPVLPGTYTIKIDRPDGLVQYAPQQTDQASAGHYVVTSSGVTTVDEALLPSGTISGRLTMADGTSPEWVDITAESQTTTVYQYTADGSFSFALYPGTYTLRFDTPYGTQWARGRSSAELADPISVAAYETITVNEQFAPFGGLEITAVDARTGVALSSFCAGVRDTWECTDTGTLTVSELLPGSHDVYAYPPDGLPDDFVPFRVTAEVTSGTVTPVVLQIVRSSVVTTVTDAETGEPVANACVELVPVNLPTELGHSATRCSNSAGEVRMPQVAPGKYKAFVWANDGIHGHQWVGKRGGVGKFKDAATIKVKAGVDVVLPGIRLDLAGTITGIVTDEATGEPLRRGTVSLSSFHSGRGPGLAQFGIDAAGRYTISGLGPYAWVLLFDGHPYAAEWSGDAVERDKAAGIVVRAGDTTVYDVALGAGTTVTGRVTGPDGAEVNDARISFYNANTGDEIATGDVYGGDGTYTTQIKGRQKVKMKYEGSIGDQGYVGWIGGDSLATAKKFQIPARGEFILNVTMTTMHTYE